MTDSLSSNTVPLTVQFRTPDTDDSTCNVQTNTVMLGIQVRCDVTIRRHFIRLLNTEDEGIGSFQTGHIT